MRSSVGLLETRSGTFTTELLGLAATGVRDKEGLVVLEEKLLKLTLGGLVVVLLDECEGSLGDGLADGHSLGAGTTSVDAHSNVEAGVALLSEQKNGLHHLHSH